MIYYLDWCTRPDLSMFSFSRFRRIDDGRSDKDEVPDVKESEENEYGSGVGFDDYGNDSYVF